MAQKRKSLKKSFRKSNRSTRRKSKTNKRKSRKIRGGDASDAIKKEVDTFNNFLNPTTPEGKKFLSLPENDTIIKNQLEKILGSHIFSRCNGDTNCEAEKKRQYQNAKTIIEDYIRTHQDGFKAGYLNGYINRLDEKIKAHTNNEESNNQ